MRIVLVTLVVAALAGCGAQPKATSQAASAAAGPAGAAGTPAQAASAPHEIAELTNQKQVFECPKCGMDFDAAGHCRMDGTELVATRVDYSCPADGKPVDGAGKCPRCAMNAHVEKTALAALPAKGTP